MHTLKPYCAASAMVLFWSGWLTLSRYGVHTSLEPADITLLRYLTTLVLLAPLIIRYPWKKFSIGQYLVVGLGVGFPYAMFSFYGLKVLRAAHAGVLVNGMLPVLGAMAAWFLFKQQISIRRYFAIGMIFLANIVMTGGSVFSLHHSAGIAMLLLAAVCYTAHMTGIRLYKMTWKDVIVIVPTVNVVLFLPLWFLFPHNLFQSPLQDVVMQAIYQGVIINILAMTCVAYAIRHLGTITVSLFTSFVPVTTALLALLFLGERLTPWEIAGIVGCSIGLGLYAWEWHKPDDKTTLSMNVK